MPSVIEFDRMELRLAEAREYDPNGASKLPWSPGVPDSVEFLAKYKNLEARLLAMGINTGYIVDGGWVVRVKPVLPIEFYLGNLLKGTECLDYARPVGETGTSPLWLLFVPEDSTDKEFYDRVRHTSRVVERSFRRRS
jgi:hypothetical protein